MVAHCVKHERFKVIQPWGSAKTVKWWCPNCRREDHELKRKSMALCESMDQAFDKNKNRAAG